MVKNTRLKRSIFAILTAAFVFLLSTSPLFAQTINFQTEDGPENVVLTQDQVVNEDYFISGDTAVLNGTVNGDAYIFGSDITVSGVVNGDVLVAGGNITIDGTINGNLRAAGGNVIVNGTVEKNITTFSGYTVITDQATLGGSLTSLSGDVALHAPLPKGMTIAAASTTISNIVGGNITAAVENLNFADGANIEGNVNYWSQTPATLATNANIEGDFNHFAPPSSRINLDSVMSTLSLIAVTLMIIFFVGALSIGLIFIKIMPNHMDTMADTAIQKTSKSLLYGFLAMIAVPIAIIILLITLVGIPLALILGVMYLIVLYISKIIVGYAIGRRLFATRQKPPARGWILLWGMLLLTICGFVPLAGWVVDLASLLIGTGAILITKENLYNTLREKDLI